MRRSPTPGAALTEALMDIGRPGGILDARDDMSAGPVRLITDPALSVNNPNNPTHPAGATFMGQFIDHDVTFDVGSTLNVPTDPATATNGRTPRLDLDTVYAGPIASSHLYDPADRAKLRIESGGRYEDLPRGSDMAAIIGDPRNDENLILSGLQCAFLGFHNRAVDYVRGQGRGRSTRDFDMARELTIRHYQWMVVNEFLPMFVGRAMVDDVTRQGRRFFRPNSGAVMPVEFQGAAYRFGHSMVRPSYRANLAGDNDAPFFGFIFDPANTDAFDPDDMVGGFRGARRFIGWQTFFDFGDGQVKPNKLIDTKLSTPLFNLPMSAIASRNLPVVLPQRTLLRHVTWSMPSGQAIARKMGATPLAATDLRELRAYGLGLEKSTPLFYYVLKEAELVNDGRFLGPVGGRIVAEVLLGLLDLDPGSYVNVRPRWKPQLPNRKGVFTGDFRMVDFLTFAGVDPTSRGQ
ncbi:MAG: peroxidase [Actinomycetota bacterium]|nr:peroxidase [Actinomycetota bacterium]